MKLVKVWMVVVAVIIFAAVVGSLIVLGMAAQEWALGGEYASL